MARLFSLNAQGQRRFSRRDILTNCSAVAACAVAKPSLAIAQAQTRVDVWNFNRLDNIGGIATRTDGAPKVIETAAGKAVQFDGVRDGLFIDKHPLAGFSRFTFEALVRPDGGGTAQRWFHLAETDLVTGLDATVSPTNPTDDTNARFTFELRVVEGERVFFESFTHGPGYQSALADRAKLHPIGHWYVVTQTYDGKMHRSYVNGELEREASLAFVPQGRGRSSVGTRINHVSYFKGAVMTARFAPLALAPSDFMKVPDALRAASGSP